MARLFSDGVCNAYLLDVWTMSSYRRHGIASTIVRMLSGAVPGQHIGLQTDDAQALYASLGFGHQPDFMSARRRALARQRRDYTTARGGLCCRTTRPDGPAGPHSSQSTTAIDENAALQLGQRRSKTPPHCAQASGMSASNSSNQRLAAPHHMQNATQSPRTFLRSSRSQSLALPMPAIVLAAAGCGHAHNFNTRRRGRALHDPLPIRAPRPARDPSSPRLRPRGKPWLLVLLHGRDGLRPDDFLSSPAVLRRPARARAPPAPYVLLLDDDGRQLLARPAHGPLGNGSARRRRSRPSPTRPHDASRARRRLDGRLRRFASRRRRHAPAPSAVTRPRSGRAGSTPHPAFYDAADFARNEHRQPPARLPETPVWIDVGVSDGFRATRRPLRATSPRAAARLAPAATKVPTGRAHIAQYLRFYAKYCSAR